MNRITTAMVIGVLAGFAHADSLPDYPFVYATGEAEERIAPDTCSVSFGIHIRDKDPTNGVRLLEVRSAEILDLLAKYEVKKEDIVGCEVSKTLIWEYAKPDRPEFHGYAIGRTIVFTFRDLRKYEPIVSALLKTPDVTDINGNFGRTDRKGIESRLSAKAVVDARTNAQMIAEGAGQRIVKLRALSHGAFNSLSAQFGLGGGDMRARANQDYQTDRGLLFIPATIRFHSEVNVIYEVEEKK